MAMDVAFAVVFAASLKAWELAFEIAEAAPELLQANPQKWKCITRKRFDQCFIRDILTSKPI
jgi:hypothetical protein